MAAELDKLDRRLLDLLQRDATLSLADLAEAVSLSRSACWRRLQKLEAQLERERGEREAMQREVDLAIADVDTTKRAAQKESRARRAADAKVESLSARITVLQGELAASEEARKEVNASVEEALAALADEDSDAEAMLQRQQARVQELEQQLRASAAEQAKLRGELDAASAAREASRA